MICENYILLMMKTLELVLEWDAKKKAMGDLLPYLFLSIPILLSLFCTAYLEAPNFGTHPSPEILYTHGRVIWGLVELLALFLTSYNLGHKQSTHLNVTSFTCIASLAKFRQLFV